MVITKKSFEPPTQDEPFHVDLATQFVKRMIEYPEYLDIIDFLAYERDDTKYLTDEELDQLADIVMNLVERAEVSVTFKEKRAKEE